MSYGIKRIITFFDAAVHQTIQQENAIKNKTKNYRF